MSTMPSEDVASQCAILDTEQVMAFIFDKLCNDTEMGKLINLKRIYSMSEDPETTIGGFKVNEKAYKLPGEKRKEMK